MFSSTKNQDVFNRSNKSCQLGGGFCIYRNCLSSTSQRFSVGLSCEKFGGQISNLLCNPLSRTIPRPFLLYGRVHYPVGRGHTIREQHVHKRVYSLQQCLGRWYVSKQASITQASLLYFLPIGHHGVMCFPANLLPLLCGPVLLNCPSLLPSPVDKGHHRHLDLGASLPLFLGPASQS